MSQNRKQQELVVKDILEGFVARFRKDDNTDTEWGSKLLKDLNERGSLRGFSARVKSDASAWGEWCFEITWTEGDGPFRHEGENSNPTLRLMVCEPYDLDRLVCGRRPPLIQEFDESKPYSLVAEYTENDGKGSCLACLKEFNVDGIPTSDFTCIRPPDQVG